MNTPIQNRRKYHRYECHFPLKVIVSNDEAFEVSAVNISLGGIRVFGERITALPVGRQVILHFKVPMIDDEVIVGAQVRMNFGQYCGLQFFSRKASDGLLASVVKLAEKDLLVLNDNKNPKTDKDIDESTVDKILHGIDIPPQPAILLTISNEKQKEFPNLKRIAEEISKDVAISAAMLRAANSPVFGLRNKVRSIQSAVMALGADVVLSIVTALALRMAMSGKGKQKFERFWDTSADTAMTCSYLAERLKVMPPDQAYMLGLFHDCGIVLMARKYTNYIDDVLKKANNTAAESIIAIEERIFNTNHATLGYLVSKSWGLPQNIRDTILNHHAEDFLIHYHHNELGVSQADTVLAKMIGLLALAEHLTHLYRADSEDRIWVRAGGAVLEMFALTEVDLQDITADVNEFLSGT